MPKATYPLPAPSLLRRLAAFFYDCLLLTALWMVTGALVLAASSGQLADPHRPAWLLYAFRSLLLLVPALFFSWFWTHGGQTLGMRAWRLKVVSADGGAVTWKAAGQRLAAACLSAALLGLGFLWVLVDRDRQAWHDRLSGTRLVVLPKRR
jgi:uncharacterized RDD family membrane protein YckC